MSIPEALKGAQAELATLRSPIEKIKRLGTYARIIGAELLGTLTVIPYGIRAHTLHRSLPDVRWGAGHQGIVSIARSVRYGTQERNIMDIYLPAEAEVVAPSSSEPSTSPNLQDTLTTSGQNAHQTHDGNVFTQSTENGLPVVLFCHGGIWATGEKWHYAPLATRLAQAGVITAVMQYTLYPAAVAPQMAGEVSQALTWTFDHIRSLGGDLDNVTLVGHSAGAQLCAMALLHRAVSGKCAPSKKASSAAKNNKILNIEKVTDVYSDGRMPRRFVGMAGVYDIAKHFQYEEARDVHTLSTMARACGGSEGFAANSPSVILRAAASGEAPQGPSPSEVVTETNLKHTRSSAPPLEIEAKASLTAQQFNSSNTTLHGEAISSRIGLDRSSQGSIYTLNLHAATTAAVHAVEPEPFLRLSLSQARRFPPTILQASTSDVTVPWYESADMHWALHDCGVPSKCLIYNRTGHGDFVVEWRPLPTPVDVHTVDDLPHYAADFVRIVTGEAEVKYIRSPIDMRSARR